MPGNYLCLFKVFSASDYWGCVCCINYLYSFDEMLCRMLFMGIYSTIYLGIANNWICNFDPSRDKILTINTSL